MGQEQRKGSIDADMWRKAAQTPTCGERQHRRRHVAKCSIDADMWRNAAQTPTCGEMQHRRRHVAKCNVAADMWRNTAQTPTCGEMQHGRRHVAKCRVTENLNFSQSNCDCLDLQDWAKDYRKPIQDLLLDDISTVWPICATVYVIRGVEKCMTSTFNFRMDKVKSKYTNGKPISDFLCIGNSNVCPIGNRLRDIHSQNLHDLDLQNGPSSNVNNNNSKANKRRSVLAIVIFALPAAVCEIATFNLRQRSQLESLALCIVGEDGDAGGSTSEWDALFMALIKHKKGLQNVITNHSRMCAS